MGLFELFYGGANKYQWYPLRDVRLGAKCIKCHGGKWELRDCCFVESRTSCVAWEERSLFPSHIRERGGRLLGSGKLM